MDAIDVAMEQINTAWTTASEEMYKASQDTNSTDEAEASGNTADDVTDVEFEEVNDDEK